MTTDLTPSVQVFRFDAAEVRVVAIDGEPWFVLADLCKVIELPNRAMVARRLDDDMKGVTQIDTPGGRQEMTIVSEAGMYEVVIRSDKSEAVTFRRWITGTVLPEIRRTGSFNATPELPTGEKLLALAVVEAQHMLAAKDERIAELEPKADLADNYLLAQGGARLVREVAKTLGWKEKDLRRWLIDEGFIFARHAPCGAVQYDFYAQFAHHFQAREKVVEHQWGTCSHYTLQVLPRGVELIHRRIKAANQ